MITVRIIVSQFIGIAATVLLLAAVAWSDADKTNAAADAATQRAQQEAEYLQLQVETELAEAAVPYLVLDLPRSAVEVRLGGVVVWNQPLQIADSDSNKLYEFVTRFKRSSLSDVRYLWDKRLYSAQERFSDSVITIVTKILEVNPELLQRELPSRFQLEWGDNLILEFRTELKVDQKRGFGKVIKDIWTELGRPWRQTVLVANMPMEEALTLYRVTHPGIPTMIITDDEM